MSSPSQDSVRLENSSQGAANFTVLPNPSADSTNRSPTSLFLVCGLGGLGQYCVSVLKEFEVTVSGIDVAQTKDWLVPDLPNLLESLTVGDFRQQNVLEQAGIRRCRAVLLVASDERINVEAAFIVRMLNPEARIIIRSDKQNLNQLLGERLGNFVAFEATQLPAAAFALAALGSGIRGFFSLNDHLLRVVKQQIDPGHPWCDRRQIHELNSRTRRVLSHWTEGTSQPSQFYQWDPDAKVQAGDTLIYIEVVDSGVDAIQVNKAERQPSLWQSGQGFAARLMHGGMKQRLQEFWEAADQNQTRQVAVIFGLIVFALLLFGAFLFKLTYPDDVSVADAFYTTAVLLLGGYADIFGGFKPDIPLPWWLRLFSFGLSLSGTAFVGILYALLTEKLLTARFQFATRRPPVPKRDHVVVIGLGRVGQGAAILLREFKQSLAGVNVGTSGAVPDQILLPELPLVEGNLNQISDFLEKVNFSTAKSVVIVTEDEVANLEIGLMVHAANPESNLVIRTFDPRFSESLSKLFPYAKVLSAYAISAEAFVAAAFGENILTLFRTNNQTILVTEFDIKSSDTLNGLLLSEVAYGYGIVALLHQRHPSEPVKLMPSQDTRLEVGDRLVALAMIDGLQRVERGIKASRRWLVKVEKAMNQEAAFEGATTIARVTGCPLSLARNLCNNLPGVLKFPLYRHQAQRLVRELSKCQVTAYLAPIPTNAAK